MGNLIFFGKMAFQPSKSAQLKCFLLSEILLELVIAGNTDLKVMSVIEQWMNILKSDSVKIVNWFLHAYSIDTRCSSESFA